MIAKRLGRRLALLMALVAASHAAADQTTKPNILFILADDLGKEWIGSYGADDIKTPHIDALARDGMTFTNAYSMPQCTPTRVTLLTGQYPWRNGWVNHWDVPRWGVGYFDWRNNITFARLLRRAGYATAAAGKWQINDFRIAPDAMAKHGFDEWCMWTGAEAQNRPSSKRYWDPYIHTREGSRTYDGKFGPDIFVDFLIGFMREHPDRPMMLYFPMALTHGPLVATPDEPRAKTKLEKHGAMVRYADKLVGRLTRALEDLRIRERTIVIFSTDNGTSGGITGTLRGRKIRGGKGTKGEPGVCAPFIVNCPGLVPAGVVTDALTDFTDLLPTFSELAGATVPRDLAIDGMSIAPLILGKTKDSPRRWIMALGHGAARVDADGVRGKVDYTPRVIRDKTFKVWVGKDRRIERLHDLRADPWEERSLPLDSGRPEIVATLKKFREVLASMPESDARPSYERRQPLPWDRKPGPADEDAAKNKAEKPRQATLDKTPP